MESFTYGFYIPCFFEKVENDICEELVNAEVCISHDWFNILDWLSPVVGWYAYVRHLGVNGSSIKMQKNANLKRMLLLIS